MTACIVLCFIGGGIYFALNPTRGSVAELARIAFFVGLLWLFYLLAEGRTLHLS